MKFSKPIESDHVIEIKTPNSRFHIHSYHPSYNEGIQFHYYQYLDE